MKLLFVLLLFLGIAINQTAAQQNWAAVPCSRIRNVDVINKLLVDSLHNELLLYCINGSTICNTTYKGLIAYNGWSFHSLDDGIDTHDPIPNVRGLFVWDCIPFGNKALVGGFFHSVGTNTLYTKSIALWNGAVWDSFPTHVFSNGLNGSGGGFYGFTKWGGKLWLYGGFDTIGNTITKNITAYNGSTFEPVPTIPVNDYQPLTKVIVYKDKLIATGNFDDYPNTSMSRLAQFDGSNWATMGTGILGGLSAINDMAVYNDTLYIAGSFPKSAGNAGNYIVKWDGNQFYDAGFGSFCGYGAIRNLITFHNRLYAFGNFECAADQKAFGIAYYDNNTWVVPQDSVDGWNILGAVKYNDAIYIGGGFKSINGDTTLSKFVKLVCPDFDAASGCLSPVKEYAKMLDVKIFPNPSSGKIQFEFEPTTSIDKITVSNPLGQEVYQLGKPMVKQEIDISHLPDGIYFLKAENRQGQAVFKIVKEE